MLYGYLYNDRVTILYGIITDFSINVPVSGDNVVDGINATEKRHLKEQMKLLRKLASNDTSRVLMITSTSNNDCI